MRHAVFGETLTPNDQFRAFFLLAPFKFVAGVALPSPVI
jgi:hypothetical protein